MPLYEYKCRRCGEEFEKLVRVSKDCATVVCPKCGDTGAERQVSLIGGLMGCGTSGGFSGGG
jgi:putative FmdB family regulatory protein